MVPLCLTPSLGPRDLPSSMPKLARLPWEAVLAVEAYGVKLGIQVSPSDALTLLPAYLPPQWRLSTSPDVDYLCSLILGGTRTAMGKSRYYRLYGGSSRLVRTLNGDAMWRTLASTLAFQVALRTPSWVFVHAGVVAWRNQGIVIPGRSYSGKTTLVKALVEAGATYYSDEYAVFDSDGMVHPYPKPLNIRQPAGEQAIATSVEEIGGKVGQDALRIGWIVDTIYCAGSQWRPKPVAPENAFLRLFDNTVVAKIDPERVFPVLRHVARQSHALHGKRGEAKEVAEQLLRRIDTELASHQP